MLLYREIARVLGYYLISFALVLCIPLAVSVYYEYGASIGTHPQPHGTWAFVYTIVIDIIIAGGCLWWGRRATGNLFRQEGLVLVVIIWFITAAIGGMPFYFSKTFENPLDCYFEAMSGLTTTGASMMTPKEYDPKTGQEVPIQKVVRGPYEAEYLYYGTISPVVDPVSGAVIAEGVEAVGKGVLFWRSFMQWLGGMGIVVLFVAVLPALGIGAKLLFQTEITGPFKEAVTPRIKETASMLWKIYLGLTVMQIVLLLWTNPQMSAFDAFTTTFSTISTGGFTVHPESINYYQNAWTDWIVIIFMLAGSLNFTLYFFCLKGKFYRIYEPEFFTYIAILLTASVFIAWQLVGTKQILLAGGDAGVFSSAEAIRHGFFQLISAQTATGFATADFNIWPLACQVLMIISMFIGGMSGSTAGGMKAIRIYMVARIIYYKLESVLRPETVRVFKINNFEVGDKTALTVLCYLLLVIFLAVLGTFLLVLDGIGPETAFSLNACMLNNIGIAFRAAGPTESFAFLSSFGKMLCTIWMVLGRLELLAVLIILLPSFWTRK
ncbi:MAG: TrkH family potassium uptake protein [Chlamydiota bacterium]